MKKTLLLYFLLLLCFQGKAAETDSTLLSKFKVVRFLTGHKYLTSPFVFYMPETSWVLGIGIKRFFNAGGEGDSLTRVSNSAVFVQYSLNNQLMIEHNYQIFTNKEKYYIVGFYGFNRFPVNYYGAGKDASLDKKELISFDHIRFENLTLRKISTGFFAGLGWRYFKTFRIQGQNGILEQSQIAGFQGSEISGLNASVLFDNRDNVLTPSTGTFAQIEWATHRTWWGSTHQFDKTIIDVRQYWRLLPSRDDVVALQTYMQLMNGNIPFNELSQLGGDMIMRGYYLGSFRDNNLLAVQAEYRWQVLKRWGIIGFAGLGGVNNSLALAQYQWKPSYGGGLRFKINRKENVNVRIDYGFGEGQQNLYFFIAEAF